MQAVGPCIWSRMGCSIHLMTLEWSHTSKATAFFNWVNILYQNACENASVFCVKTPAAYGGKPNGTMSTSPRGCFAVGVRYRCRGAHCASVVLRIVLHFCMERAAGRRPYRMYVISLNRHDFIDAFLVSATFKCGVEPDISDFER